MREMNPYIEQDADGDARDLELKMCTLVRCLNPSMFTSPFTQTELLDLIDQRGYVDNITRERILCELDSCKRDYDAPATIITPLQVDLKKAAHLRKTAIFAHRTCSPEEQLMHLSH
jgi:hypothetical protein